MAKKYDICSKDDYGKWYQSVLTVSDMIDYSDVGGCYVLKPWSLEMWELIKQNLDKSIRDLGVENCYFPLFATRSNLQKEASHFSDFTPEVAWVETDSDKVSKTDDEVSDAIKQIQLKGHDVSIRVRTDERYAIRPTSETIIYPHFSSWIKKSGKYPKINQWANVVRWENKMTQPFIRSREFLWQEGHTCHRTKIYAIKEVFTVLDMYKHLYQNLLAVPTIDGIKTVSETFPGAECTATIECFLPDSGKGIQSATSHYLGQKFSKIFNITDSNGELVHQNSWGLTTRSIGIMVMTHSDNRGLVLPPPIAPIQVVIVACGLNSKTTDDEKSNVESLLSTLCDTLNSAGIRTVFDDELGETPGMKFNKWEVKGVPVRLEFGPKDVLNDSISFVRRDKPPKTKEVFKFSSINSEFVKAYLETVRNDMFEKAKDKVKKNVVCCSIDNVEEFISVLKNKKLALIEWNDSYNQGTFETDLKNLCKNNDILSTKILCLPSQTAIEELGLNVDLTKQYALFGRSY